MEEYALYCYIRDYIKSITNKYSISHNDYDLNGNNIIGILTSGGLSPKYRNIANGRYAGHNSRVQLIIQSGLSTDELFDVLELVSKLRDFLTSSCLCKETLVSDVVYVDGYLVKKTNDIKTYNTCYITINKTSMLGEAKFKGKTSQGKPIYVMNYNINYYFNQGG